MFLTVEALTMTTIGRISKKIGVTEADVCEYIGRPANYFTMQMLRPGKNREKSDILRNYEATSLGMIILKRIKD